MALNKKRTTTSVKAVISPAAQPAIATPDKNKGEHLNFMGGISYDPSSPLTRLRMAAASCFFGEPSYYQGAPSKSRKGRAHPSSCDTLTEAQRKALNATLNAVDPQEWRGLDPRSMMEHAIDAALEADPRAALEFAVELRQKLNIRTTPQVIMVRAAMHPKVKGTGLITEFAQQIMQRLDEVPNQYAYFLDIADGHTPPKPLKRNWARRIERAQQYEMAKYRQESRTVKLTDVVSICHASSPCVDALMKGDLKLGTDEIETWESARSAGKSWAEAATHMGHMALLRNLRNLEQNSALTPTLLHKLVEGAKTGRQLPFRYLSAYKAAQEAGARGVVLDTIEECLELSMDNLPVLDGKVAVLSDNSGSAWGTTTSEMGTMHVAEIGNLMGVLTAKRASEDGVVGVFGDRLQMIPVRRKSSVFDTQTQLDTAGKHVGSSTEHGIWLFFQQAIEQRQHYDWIFVYSDMQAGHGGLYGTGKSYVVDGHECRWSGRDGHHPYISVADLVAVYRRTVNKNVKVFLVQTAGYQDTLIPEWYDKTWILGGWSPEVIRFAAHAANLQSQPAQAK